MTAGLDDGQRCFPIRIRLTLPHTIRTEVALDDILGDLAHVRVIVGFFVDRSADNSLEGEARPALDRGTADLLARDGLDASQLVAPASGELEVGTRCGSNEAGAEKGDGGYDVGDRDHDLSFRGSGLKWSRRGRSL
ncbi:hypothetical protein BDK51DRAFT_52958 [Blyttiomyces helicus]|uniref:Uncharacterized protein n=1 Tax=Blyttiomyces helicus TaxID=388810 RepID=A0A4P9VYG9_9FUNG|nr:hypothetical protein BDK51DRAFT_52958 [Blyttiomyces helicus]|eukprot:RKO83348.1 hypothetical protein BDK51DRAFT_52958 [Blyttiomyces helicus]